MARIVTTLSSNPNLKRMNHEVTKRWLARNPKDKRQFGIARKNIFIGYDDRDDENALARIWTRVTASKPAGCPGDGPALLLDVTEWSCRLRRPMQRSFGHGPTLNRPSRPNVRPPAERARAAFLGNPHGRSDERGCIGRLRSRLGAKLLRIPPPQAGYSLPSVPSKMPARPSPGQPAGFEAAARSGIRANACSSARKSQPIKIFFLPELGSLGVYQLCESNMVVEISRGVCSMVESSAWGRSVRAPSSLIFLAVTTTRDSRDATAWL